jgi:hypothetical protein
MSASSLTHLDAYRFLEHMEIVPRPYRRHSPAILTPDGSP